jgi:probable F420-dependent oxidoreductase
VGLWISTNIAAVDMKPVAREVEALGFDSLWVPDHPAFPRHFTSDYGGGRTFPEHNKQLLDPFVALATAAGATDSLLLGTGVLLVPERNPILTAKAVASLDQVSGGRFLFGIGAGWLREEGELLGVDWARRWTQTGDFMRAMQALWAPGTNAYEGRYISFPELYCDPKPVRVRRPPVIIGGEAARAVERVVDYGDGWLPRYVLSTPEQIEAGIRRLETLCRERGRDPAEIETSLFDCDGTRETYRRYGDVGVQRIVQLVPYGNREETLAHIRRLADAVL